MHHKIFPCLWFPDKKDEAVSFYQHVFGNVNILENTPMVTTCIIRNTKCMLLEGGPQYRVNQAVSYFIYTGDFAEAERLYTLLAAGGKVFMPLQAYDWSPCYAWVEDKYGVSWQIDGEAIRSEQKIVPCLLFTNDKKYDVKKAIHHYAKIFPASRVLMEAPFTPAPDVPEEAILFGQVLLDGFVLNLMSSPMPMNADFTPGNSFVIPCETQEEIDFFWEKLGDGGEYQMCGWLTDMFGVSWQVVPAILSQLMSDPVKGPRVIEAFLKMQKFDIAKLLAV